MRIESVRAHPFGPMEDQELVFGPGLTVVSGGNETGKSSWHAAASTALVGRRKGRSRKVDVDLSRYKPWADDAWAVSCVVSLEDGRQIRLVHNLATGRSTAMDDSTGADLTAELTHEGGVDASTLVGLNRLTLPLVSSVRQADILSLSAAKKDDLAVASLRDLLQQAVSSRAATDSSAEQAIARLEAFAREHIGTEKRGSSKPLRVASDALAAAKTQRDQAVAAWEEMRHNELQLASAQDRVQRVQKRLSSLEAAQLQYQAEQAIRRVERAEALAASVEAAPPVGADADGQAEVQDLVHARRALTPVPDAPARSSRELAELLEQVPTVPDGPLTPSVALEQLTAKLETAMGAASAHCLVPKNRPAKPTHDLPASELRAAAAAVNNPPQPATASAAAPVVPLVIALLLGTGCVGAAIATASSVVVSSVLFIAALMLFVGVGAVWARSRRPVMAPASVAAAERHAALVERLAAAGLTAESAALEAEADEVESRVAAARDYAEWVDRGAVLDRQVSNARDALQDRLAQVGVAVPHDAETKDANHAVLQAMNEHRAACSRRAADQAQQRDRVDLEHQLRQAQDLEARRSALEAEHKAWNQAAWRAVRRLGLVHPDGSEAPESSDDGAPVDVQVLQSWLAAQQDATAASMQARADEAALAEILQGSSVAELAREAKAAEAAARDAVAALGIDELPQSRPDKARAAQLTRDLHAAQEAEHRLTGSIEEARRSLSGLAEVNEAVSRAQYDYERLVHLDSLIAQTRGYLTQARQTVHRQIAPLIAQATNDRLARVSAGRYKQIRVDPEDLSVQVELADGSWRSAEALSHGTTEQIYLLARIAIAETVATTESCPLLLDDVTVHADDDRTEALLELLLELSADRQIVLFSQEDSVRTWAAGSRATTVELEAI